ncbi:hypothetical protein [Maritimibacter sp. DP1N21-5]|uniref:hypothetical protein n=1 Tax=Maritimibacter sp. DP1N21-5 TaxID=2836867 RepID=UPI001C450D49|nr:hypothetical protein [Maritimibacter sp. DP1N21-5]MBV7410601.1 hypothetical protein [Maritimibacter sp. DP1N21-5]
MTNRDTWGRLTEDERRLGLAVGVEDALTSLVLNLERNESGVQAFRDTDKTVYEATEADLAKITEFFEQDRPVIRAQYADQYGLENVDGKIATIVMRARVRVVVAVRPPAIIVAMIGALMKACFLRAGSLLGAAFTPRR